MTAAWGLLVDENDPKVIRKMAAGETFTAETGQSAGVFNGTMSADVVPLTYKMVGDFAAPTFEPYMTDAQEQVMLDRSVHGLKFQLDIWLDDLSHQREDVRLAGNSLIYSGWAGGYYVYHDAVLTRAQKTVIFVQATLGAVDVDSVVKFLPVAVGYVGQPAPTRAKLWVGRDGVRTMLANAHDWGAMTGRAYHEVY